jgi:dTDP-4-amino-4,6-dideoxygalactose transaminase
VEPIKSFGAKVVFYNVRPDCQVDLDDIVRRMTCKPRALMIIHYYGFPQPARRLREFCRAHHLHLIEDCAHVLAGETDGKPLGRHGDVSIFSWRKFLPVYDGGQLLVNDERFAVSVDWERQGIPLRLKAAKNLADKLLEDASAGPARWLLVLLHAAKEGWRRITARSRSGKKVDKIDPFRSSFDLATANVGMTGLSQRILRNADIPEIVRRRRENYSRLRDELQGVDGVTPLHPTLAESLCPWAFPVLVPDRPGFVARLREMGIPAFTWEGVIHPDLPLAEFPDADFLFHHLILLPMHQSIELEDIKTIVRTIAQALDKRSRT